MSCSSATRAIAAAPGIEGVQFADEGVGELAPLRLDDIGMLALGELQRDDDADLARHCVALDHRQDDRLDVDEIRHAVDMPAFDALLAIDGQRRRCREG